MMIWSNTYRKEDMRDAGREQPGRRRSALRSGACNQSATMITTANGLIYDNAGYEKRTTDGHFLMTCLYYVIVKRTINQSCSHCARHPDFNLREVDESSLEEGKGFILHLVLAAADDQQPWSLLTPTHARYGAASSIQTSQKSLERQNVLSVWHRRSKEVSTVAVKEARREL